MAGEVHHSVEVIGQRAEFADFATNHVQQAVRRQARGTAVGVGRRRAVGDRRVRCGCSGASREEDDRNRHEEIPHAG